MSEDVVDRLRQALVSRAEQVTPESLRPADVPQPARSRPGSRIPAGSWWSTWRTPVLVAAAAAIVMIGLATLRPGADDDTLPPSPATVVTGSSCEREAVLVRTALDTGGVLADVDGDGEPDRVVTAVDGEAGAKCRAFVGVRTASGTTYSTALTAPAVPPPGVEADVIGLPDLGSDGRADIVVDTHLMADGSLAQLFTLTEEGLVRVPAPAFEDGNFIVAGGGVTSPQAAGCTTDGSLILSMASSSDGQDFTVTRQIYPVTGPPLEFGSPDVSTGHASAAELTTRFPEFGADSFAPCGGES